MKLEITGKNVTKEDLVDILTFLREKWSKRKDVLGVFVIEGTETDTVEELMRIMDSVFKGRENWTEILRIKNEHR